MPTPSFVKRMRRNIGNTVTFTSPVNGTRKVIVRDVKFATTTGNYVLVGRDVTNISKNGSPWRSFKISNIKRPVRYSR